MIKPCLSPSPRRLAGGGAFTLVAGLLALATPGRTGDAYLLKAGPAPIRISLIRTSALPSLSLGGDTSTPVPTGAALAGSPLAAPTGRPADASAATETREPTPVPAAPTREPEFVGPVLPTEAAGAAPAPTPVAPQAAPEPESSIISVQSGSKGPQQEAVPTQGGSITAQALVRFFHRDSADPVSVEQPIRSETGLLFPVRFVPPEPLATVPGSSATYSTPSK